MVASAGRLYKTIKFHHAVQLFQTGKLYLARPESWEDPYETRLTHKDFKRVYAQCWCGSGVSDAMWRIYSPDHLGIRIGTSTKKLRAEIAQGTKDKLIEIKSREVDYLAPYDLNEKTKSMMSSWKKGNSSISECSEILFMKRKAYEHEDEFRVIAIDQSDRFDEKNGGLFIDVDPFKLIDSILIDPRAPKELSDALVHYFSTKIGFKKKCKQSVLYRKPRALEVGDPLSE